MPMTDTEIGNMLRDIHEQTALLREIRDSLRLLTQGRHAIITPAMSADRKRRRELGLED